MIRKYFWESNKFSLYLTQLALFSEAGISTPITWLKECKKLKYLTTIFNKSLSHTCLDTHQWSQSTTLILLQPIKLKEQTMWLKAQIKNNIWKSLRRTFEISKKTMNLIKSSFCGRPTPKDLPLFNSIFMAVTKLLWRQSKKTKVKSHLQHFLPLLQWRKDVLSSMDHLKILFYQAWAKYKLEFTLETILKLDKPNSKLLLWTFWQGQESSQNHLFLTITWETMTEKISHPKSNSSQKKPQNLNVFQTF